MCYCVKVVCECVERALSHFSLTTTTTVDRSSPRSFGPERLLATLLCLLPLSLHPLMFYVSLLVVSLSLVGMWFLVFLLVVLMVLALDPFSVWNKIVYKPKDNVKKRNISLPSNAHTYMSRPPQCWSMLLPVYKSHRHHINENAQHLEQATAGVHCDSLKHGILCIKQHHGYIVIH